MHPAVHGCVSCTVYMYHHTGTEKGQKKEAVVRCNASMLRLVGYSTAEARHG